MKIDHFPEGFCLLNSHFDEINHLYTIFVKMREIKEKSKIIEMKVNLVESREMHKMHLFQ